MPEGASRRKPTPTGRSLAYEAIRRGAIDLAQGVVHAMPPQILLDLCAQANTNRLVHGYGPPQGDPTFVEAMADLLAPELPRVQPENILGTAGVTAGISSALISHCEPGVGVLVTEPFYTAYTWILRAARCQPLFIPHAENWSPRWDILEERARDAQAILFANPANPSGYLWSRADLDRLLGIARAHNILVIADEIYHDFVWESVHESLVGEVLRDDHVVVLRGFSKNLAIAGWRVGYAIATPERIQKLILGHDALYPGGVSLLQHVVGKGWREHRAELEEFITRQRETYRASRAALADIFRGLGMEPLLPQGAIYMMLRHNWADDLAAIQEILDRGVAIAPGRSFYGDTTKPSPFVRIHFAVSPETVAEVRRRLVGDAKG